MSKGTIVSPIGMTVRGSEVFLLLTDVYEIAVGICCGKRLQLFHMVAIVSTAGILVEFDQYHKREEAVVSAAGFDMAPYDRVTSSYRGQSLPVSLWEYGHHAASDMFTLHEFDMCTDPVDSERKQCFVTTCVARIFAITIDRLVSNLSVVMLGNCHNVCITSSQE